MNLDFVSLEIFQNKFIIGTLFFARITALMATGPFFNNQAIQPMAKIAISAVLALLMTTAFAQNQPPIELETFAVLPLMFKEVFIGALIGFAAQIPFHAVRFAGGVTDFDMGFQTSLLFNVNLDAPTLIGEIYSLIALGVFLTLNGHHFLLEAVYASVEAVPLTKFAMTPNAMQALVGTVTTMTMVGVKIGAPILVSLFLVNLALAVLSRVAPQLNIFSLSIQFKMIVGLIVLMSTIPLTVLVIRNVLTMFERDVMTVLMALKP